MKKGKRVKPKFPIEYRLLVTKLRTDKEILTLIALRTVNEFKNFLYEIVVEPVIDNRTIHINIHGLRAPQVSIPGTGPATFRTELQGLHGQYDVVISKPNHDQNLYGVNISDQLVEVDKSPKKRFVDLVTKEEEW